MTVIDAFHAQITPELEERLPFFTISGDVSNSDQLEINELPDFVAGIGEFDRVIDNQRYHYHNLSIWTRKENGLLSRGILERGIRQLRTSVLVEVIPEHPKYEPEDTKYFVEMFKIARHGLERAEIDGFRARETRIVRLMLELGKIAN